MLNKPKIFDFSEILGFCAFSVRSSSICVPKVAQILPKSSQTLGVLVWTYRALPIGPIGPYKGPIRALIGPF